MRIRTKLIVLFIFVLWASFAYAERRAQSMASYDDVRSFIKEISERNKLDIKIVRDAFSKSYFDYAIPEIMERPAEFRSWLHYSQGILSDIRIKLGREYLSHHTSELAAAEKQWNVPASVITSIIGVESTYGTAPFRYTAVQSLGTLAFEYPRRAKYFKVELENLFIFAHKDGINPLDIRGSYAGAIGIPQFMPSNIITYGKDGNGDGHVDLVNSHADAISSIAYYMYKHGWQNGKNTATLVTLSKKLNEQAFNTVPCEKKNFRTVAQLRQMGVIFPKEYPATELAMLAKLDEDNGGYTPIVFFENACTIHRYNRSLKYTAAISLLAAKISEEAK